MVFTQAVTIDCAPSCTPTYIVRQNTIKLGITGGKSFILTGEKFIGKNDERVDQNLVSNIIQTGTTVLQDRDNVEQKSMAGYQSFLSID